MVAIGGAVEIAPLFWVNGTVEKVSGMRPYTPLELEGRNIYVREGCYLCHSQHDPHAARRGRTLWPLQPGGGKHVRPSLPVGLGAHRSRTWRGSAANIPIEWHRAHLADPRSVVPESIMPPYKFLVATPLDYRDIQQHAEGQSRMSGVPYTDDEIAHAKEDLEAQADPNSDGVDAFQKRYPKAQARDFDGNPEQITEGRCPDRLSADAGHAGGLQDLPRRRPGEPEIDDGTLGL